MRVVPANNDDTVHVRAVQTQAVRADGFLFTAQIALDPDTNTLLKGDVAQQTERGPENLKTILTRSGLALSHVVTTTVFLKDMNDFIAKNEVYAKYFPSGSGASVPPARIL